MELSTYYMIMILIAGVLFGAITAKIAEERRVGGDSYYWFIAGTLLTVVALPAAIFFKPDPRLAEQEELASGKSRSVRAAPRRSRPRRGSADSAGTTFALPRTLG